MHLEKWKNRISKLTFYLELVLALFIIVSIVIGMVDLLRYIVLIFETNPIDTYELLQKFLGHVLLMVVGIELVIMLVYHSPSSVIEVLLYAVARKVLIGNAGMVDFMIGIIAIAAIFAIRKYLFVEEIDVHAARGNSFSAATSVKTINEILEVNISEELGNTVGGVICSLAHASGIQLHEGAEFKVSKVRMRIIKMKDGVIEKVSIRTN